MSSNGTYIGPLYEQNGIVNGFHSVPRFGGPNDITFLLAPTSAQDTSSYALGASFITLLLCGIFLVWAVGVWTLQCTKPPCVGFLSGAPMQEPILKDRASRFRPMMVRSMFLLFTAIILASCIVMLAVGFPVVEQTAVTLNDGVNVRKNRVVIFVVF